MRLRRRELLQWLAAPAALAVANPATAAETRLPTPESLPAAAEQAAAQGQPLLLLASLPGCRFCEELRRSHLLPGLRADTAATRLYAVQLDLRNPATLIDFDGQRRSQDAVLRRLGVRFAPTVLLLGPRGQALAEPLIGALLPDFYASYLDERLGQARQALRP